jgi:DNA-directed RNA polymerase beta' subunit
MTFHTAGGVQCSKKNDLLGLRDKYYMILKVMPVPSPPVSPTLPVDGVAMRGEHGLTYKLGAIIELASIFEEKDPTVHPYISSPNLNSF